MHTILKAFFFSALLVVVGPACSRDKPLDKKEETAQLAESCEHGVKKTICTRCNPKLQVAFKAKNDWCEEHQRAESQCAICHPELAKEGVKP